MRDIGRNGSHYLAEDSQYFKVISPFEHSKVGQTRIVHFGAGLYDSLTAGPRNFNLHARNAVTMLINHINEDVVLALVFAGG